MNIAAVTSKMNGYITNLTIKIDVLIMSDLGYSIRTVQFHISDTRHLKHIIK